MHTDDAEQRLRAALAAAIETHDAPADAVEAVVAMIDAERPWRRALATKLTREAMQQMVYRQRNRQRAAIKTASAPTPATMTEASAARRAQWLSSIMDTWRVGSFALGDCTAEDLRTAASAERAKASGHAVNAAFYEALAAKIGRKRVRSVMDAARVSALLDAAKRSSGSAIGGAA